MTPARIMYLIRYQGPQWFEPQTYFGNNTLKDVYDYEPVQADWKPEYASLLIGVRGIPMDGVLQQTGRCGLSALSPSGRPCGSGMDEERTQGLDFIPERTGCL